MILIKVQKTGAPAYTCFANIICKSTVHNLVCWTIETSQGDHLYVYSNMLQSHRDKPVTSLVVDQFLILDGFERFV